MPNSKILSILSIVLDYYFRAIAWIPEFLALITNFFLIFRLIFEGPP
ncbi:MAG: hypothetical protein QW100_00365 [Thermoplasmatales archaeon]